MPQDVLIMDRYHLLALMDALTFYKHCSDQPLMPETHTELDELLAACAGVVHEGAPLAVARS